MLGKRPGSGVKHMSTALCSIPGISSWRFSRAMKPWNPGEGLPVSVDPDLDELVVWLSEWKMASYVHSSGENYRLCMQKRPGSIQDYCHLQVLRWKNLAGGPSVPLPVQVSSSDLEGPVLWSIWGQLPARWWCYINKCILKPFACVLEHASFRVTPELFFLPSQELVKHLALY